MYDTTDTSKEAEDVQLALLQAMSGRDRVRQTCVLSSHLRQMAFDAIRRQFPDIEEDEYKLLFIELTYGKSVSDAVRSDVLPSDVTGASA